MNLENLYQLRSLLNVIIQEEEDRLRNKPFQSEMGKTFHQRLHEKMEKKQVRPNEHFLNEQKLTAEEKSIPFNLGDLL